MINTMKIFYNVTLLFLTLFIGSCAGDNPLILDPVDKYLLKVVEQNNKLYTIGTEGKIFYSTDGNSWTKINSNVNQTLTDIYFWDNQQTYITGEKGLFLKSTDGGNNWDFTQIPSNQSFNSVFFLDKDMGWVSGNNGKLFISTNGGNSWQDTSFLDEGFLTEVYFENNGFGFVTGSKDAIFSEALLYITNDFGQSWEEIDLSSYEINGIINVKYFSNGIYIISENKILYTSKSNKFKDFEIIADVNIADDNIENKFKITTMHLENNETIVAGFKGHNLGMIYNKDLNTFVKTNIHILDMIKFNSLEFYFGGYGYKIYKKNVNNIDIIELEQ
ncbi:MAG: WD40/YVTN/BNR-like repeat-containing protein [Candidatus Kapaibacteriota bacterium]